MIFIWLYRFLFLSPRWYISLDRILKYLKNKLIYQMTFQYRYISILTCNRHRSKRSREFGSCAPCAETSRVCICTNTTLCRTHDKPSSSTPRDTRTRKSTGSWRSWGWLFGTRRRRPIGTDTDTRCDWARSRMSPCIWPMSPTRSRWYRLFGGELRATLSARISRSSDSSRRNGECWYKAGKLADSLLGCKWADSRCKLV